MKDQIQNPKSWLAEELSDKLKTKVVKKDGCAKESLLKLVSEIFPNKVETPLETYLRAEKTKSFLRKEHISNSGKVVLVGHRTFFKYLTATAWELIPNQE